MTESKHGKPGDARSEPAHSETLSSRSRDALASYRASPTWGDSRESSVLRRVETSVQAGARGPDLDASASRRPRLDIPRTALRMVVAVAAAAAVLLLIRAMDLRSLVGGASQEVREQAEYGQAEAARTDHAVNRRGQLNEGSPAPAKTPKLTSPASTHGQADPVPLAVHPPARKPRPRPTSEPAPLTAKTVNDDPPDPLRDEMQLMQRARSALAKGNGSAALAVLRMHAERHPKGQMSEDREALRPAAHCTAGSSALAAAQAKAFVLAYPGSAHAGKVRTTLQLAEEKKCGVR